MLDLPTGLDARALAAIEALEQRTVAADGGRLKLEWGTLRSRRPDESRDVLWWDGDRLLGFLGIYGFGGPALELAGMVDPVARRQGIGRALLAAALPLTRSAGSRDPLLIVPRPSVAGAALAARFGARLDHSEHALLLTGEPTDGPADPRITLRDATPDDRPAIMRVMAAAFDWVPADFAERLTDERSELVVIDLGGEPVGCVRLSLEGDAGGVYGFAVDPARQGQGIGRQALRLGCRRLRAGGATSVRLEVAVENESALGLYTSSGFAPVTTEDYYAVPPQ